ncbi:MAG: hypothetical protein HQM14_16130 [SAR324 cluster bacterium]|nr:hypothetical protein [SAR324 cluster bacterium]
MIEIDYEIVVDCYDEYEQAMGWIIYLSENLNCPFKAEYIKKIVISSCSNLQGLYDVFLPFYILKNRLIFL